MELTQHMQEQRPASKAGWFPPASMETSFRVCTTAECETQNASGLPTGRCTLM